MLEDRSTGEHIPTRINMYKQLCEAVECHQPGHPIINNDHDSHAPHSITIMPIIITLSLFIIEVIYEPSGASYSSPS